MDDVIAKHSPNFSRCRAVVVFNLKHFDDLIIKLYFLSHWRALQSEISIKIIISDAVRAYNEPDELSYDKSLDIIISYLSTFEEQENASLIWLLFNNCVTDTLEIRFKVYILAETISLIKLNEMYNLSDRLKGVHIIISLKRIREL